MPTITELPNDASESYGAGLVDSDHQLQPMDCEENNVERPQNASVQRDAGRVSVKIGLNMISVIL